MVEEKKPEKEVEEIPPYRGWLIGLRLVRSHLYFLRENTLKDTAELPARFECRVLWDWKAQREVRDLPTEEDEHSQEDRDKDSEEEDDIRETIVRLETITKKSQEGHIHQYRTASAFQMCEVANDRFIIQLPLHERFTEFSRRYKGEDVYIGEVEKQMMMALKTAPQTLAFDGKVGGEPFKSFMNFRSGTLLVDEERQTTYYPLALEFTYQVSALLRSYKHHLDRWCSTWTPEEEELFWTNCFEALDEEINRVIRCIGREVVGDYRDIEAGFVFEAEEFQSKYLTRGFDRITVAGKHRLGSYPRELIVGAGETGGLLDRVVSSTTKEDQRDKKQVSSSNVAQPGRKPDRLIQKRKEIVRELMSTPADFQESGKVGTLFKRLDFEHIPLPKWNGTVRSWQPRTWDELLKKPRSPEYRKRIDVLKRDLYPPKKGQN